jgi:hypothetical protein
MKPRYAVINEFERDEYEKNWQVPFGYNGHFITFNPKEAVRHLDFLATEWGENQLSQTIVEKISDEGRELYYRI